MKTRSGRFNGYAVFGNGSSSVILEVASTPSEKSKGLAGRSRMMECCGMLFTDLSGGSFWMKGCKIPLDIIFFKDGIVTRTYSMKVDGGAKLYQYDDEPEAIEVAYGFCSRHGIEPGVKVETRVW